MDEEMRLHLAMEEEDLVRGGASPDAARRDALRSFGGVERFKEEGRDARGVRWLEDLGQDLRYGLRALVQQKGFTAVVLLILALGIGANAATFTLIDALVLRALPVPHPDELVTIGDPSRTGSLSQGSPRTSLASYPVYADLRDQNRVLTGLYANGRTGRLDVVIPGEGAGGTAGGPEAEHPRGRLVSENFFAVLQVPAHLGRTFSPDEGPVPGGDPVAVLSYAYWQRRFGGARGAVGRVISINGTPVTIVGVAAKGFSGDIVGQPTEIWLPLMMQPAIMSHSPWLDDRSSSWLLLMGRLAPGVTVERARAELAALDARSILDHATADQATQLRRYVREDPAPVGPGAQGFSYYRSAYAQSLFTIMAAVGLVLLLVCANVANLTLARAAARGREMGVRMALGAGRARLVRQLLTESLVLALAGGALGLVVAQWGSAVLLRLASTGPNPIPLDVRLDGRVLAFTAALALFTSVVFGLAPALGATRVELATTLRAQARAVGGAALAPGRLALGKLLVVAQVGLSVILLVGTGMLVRSLERLNGADLGLDRDRLVIAWVDGGRSGYAGARLIALMRDLIERARRVPGVATATVSHNGIFSGTESGTRLQVEGFIARADSDTSVAYDDVGPGYFHTIGARLTRGRDFEERDAEKAPKVAIVNETMARFFFPAGDAVGRHITDWGGAWTIVGVVADINEQNLHDQPRRRFYVPTFQVPDPPDQFYLEVRASGDPAPLVVPIRRALAAGDPSLAVLGVDRLTNLIASSISHDRLVAHVVSIFGLLAMVLAALGLYGVMAYGATRRTNEFGLRIALGAEPRDVMRLVLREALALTVAGLAIGLPAALAATRLLGGQVFGIGPLDLPSFGLAVAVLGLSAGLAAAIPALRASHVSPLEALRVE
jgi:predicted permease